MSSAFALLRSGPRVGVLLWLAQVLYLPIELVAVALSRVPYSLWHNTISDLGAMTCTTISYPAQDVPVCSPAHTLVNVSFVLFGLAMVAGAVLLRPRLPPGGMVTTAVVLWGVAGASSVGSGLTPLDQMINLHAFVSTPGIVLSGVAMLLTGIALARSWRRPAWWWLVGSGAVSAGAGVLLVVRLEVQWGGLIERLALWPSFAACAIVAVAVLRNPTHRHEQDGPIDSAADPAGPANRSQPTRRRAARRS